MPSSEFYSYSHPLSLHAACPISIPIAWSPPTNVTLSAPVIVAPMSRSEDLDQWRGKLAGRIVLVTRPDEGSEPDRAPFRRYDDADIAKMDEFEQPKYDPEAADRRMKRANFANQLDAFPKTDGEPASEIGGEAGRERGGTYV